MKRTTPDGWTLHFNRVQGDGPPVLMVPGFAMNPSILSFHPRGRSFMHALRDRGFDCWSVELRGIGRNKGGRHKSVGLAEKSDLPLSLLDRVARACSSPGCRTRRRERGRRGGP